MLFARFIVCYNVLNILQNHRFLTLTNNLSNIALYDGVY